MQLSIREVVIRPRPKLDPTYPAVVVFLPTPLTIVCGWIPIIPLLVQQPAYLSIWPAAPSLQWVPKTTAYKRWNCQVIRPANCWHFIPSNRFLNGFPDPSQFAVAKLTLHSMMPHQPSDSSRPRQHLLLSGDVHQNPGPATKYPCSVCTSNVKVVG